MKQTIRIFSIISTLALVAALVIPTTALSAKTRLGFSGGPEGGTFQYFSNGISSRLSKMIPDVEVSNMASAGSVENVRRVNSGEADFGIAYSGDTYLARNGRLTNDTNTYPNVHAMAFLYGAPAHLIVLENSGINAVADLEGKRIAVGGAGSGAAAAAQRFFGALGLWDKMNIEFIGYSKAAAAIGDGLIDAMWVFAGFPNSSVIQAAASNKIKILNTYEAGEKGGAFEQYPFYAPITIPAGTYSGVDYEVKSFQDSALWVAGKHVADDHVYDALANIYTPEGLSYMVKVKSTAKSMSIDGALTGIVTPVHTGAQKFWKEKGLTLTEAQMGE
ncbi:MAG: TAXI family TRAP transporter solute-binding subunit [Deltaproteobacteria bacterium]|jgi:TRAP transporter TAXI family solute receptor|nr:TAXI family TRAP transporter solute-binding subunit [Deltaproteobacteria bacterium]MBW2504209.1 TAXI family TRAP transporter solute-binding subunit [Deltaproteobacteria bacterium]MBW2519577.1 TAXI family TRAP transporter solute-binding subunit [Deltaproteobacteria bacterium]